MSVRELKAELSARQISTQDAFEKEILVQRLLEARQRQSKFASKSNTSSDVSASSSSSSSPKTTRSIASDFKNNNILEIPLHFTYMDGPRHVAAAAGSSDSSSSSGGRNSRIGITIEPTDLPYPTIAIQIPSSDDDKGQWATLNLLLDTACSGFVLRPSVLDQYKHLPKLTTPVTMTGAGGTMQSSTGLLTQLQRFKVGSQSLFGPLPASVQDIGALPPTLDGIIGLSFLQQFACVELNLVQDVVRLYHSNYPDTTTVPNSSNNDDTSRGGLELVAESEMRLLPRLGIYTVPVWLGAKGPVELLVDTGASCTLLSWKGVHDLGLDRTSRHIQPLTRPTGAMGSDNIAMALTHRLNVSSQYRLGRSQPESNNGAKRGVSLAGSRRLSVDIGNIPLLDTLQNDGVGGILGMDAFMKCAMVRIFFQGPNRRIALYDKLAP